jgi:hypothetical protein
MFYAGLDLSRKRLDFHLLDGEGATVEVGAAGPDADGLRGPSERLGHLVPAIWLPDPRVRAERGRVGGCTSFATARASSSACTRCCSPTARPALSPICSVYAAGDCSPGSDFPTMAGNDRRQPPYPCLLGRASSRTLRVGAAHCGPRSVSRSSGRRASGVRDRGCQTGREA